jgi:hypothetical protein
MDDQDWTDADPFRGYPLVATLTGLAVITLTSVFLSRFIALPALAVLLAAGSGLGLLLWRAQAVPCVKRAAAPDQHEGDDVLWHGVDRLAEQQNRFEELERGRDVLEQAERGIGHAARGGGEEQQAAWR